MKKRRLEARQRLYEIVVQKMLSDTELELNQYGQDLKDKIYEIGVHSFFVSQYLFKESPNGYCEEDDSNV